MFRGVRRQMTASTTDNAGAMRVSPGTRAGRRPVRTNPAGEITLTMGKQLSQGPTTGFGSFRGVPVSADQIHDVPR